MFLRVLEYYNGILFLTTNRVGALDEAFKSRIHISLYYPKLSKAQTMEIFKVNIKKLGEREKEKRELEAAANSEYSKKPALFIDDKAIMHYANWLFDSYSQAPHQRWNGRQIRNAFQIAYSLVDYDTEDTSWENWEEKDATAGKSGQEAVSGPTLNHRQFQTVAKSIEKFDHYLEDAIQATEVDQARLGGLRADDHDPKKWEGHVYNDACQGDQLSTTSPVYRHSRTGPPSTPVHPHQARSQYSHQSEPQHDYQPMYQSYQEPRKGYRSPHPASHSRASPREVVQERSRSDNLVPSTRHSPSSFPHRPKPFSGYEDYPGNSGWSTGTTAKHSALRSESAPLSGEEAERSYDSGDLFDEGEQHYALDEQRYEHS